MGALRYNIMLLVANVLFGASFSIYVALLQGALHFEQMFALQLLFSMLVFTPSAVAQGDFFRLSLNDFGTIFIVALLVIFGWWYLLMMGASYTNPIDASTISTLGPTITFLTAIIAHSRRARVGEVVGILVAFAGAVVLLFDRGGALINEGGEGYGNALVLCAVAAIAINTVLIAPILRRHGTVKVMGWYYLIGALLAMPIIAEQLPPLQLSDFSHLQYIELGYILLFGSTLPMYMLYVATAHLTAAHTALYRYIQPVVATVLSVWRGQSAIDRTNILGAVLILCGMLCVIASMPRAERVAIRE